MLETVNSQSTSVQVNTDARQATRRTRQHSCQHVNSQHPNTALTACLLQASSKQHQAAANTSIQSIPPAHYPGVPESHTSRLSKRAYERERARLVAGQSKPTPMRKVMSDQSPSMHPAWDLPDHSPTSRGSSIHKGNRRNATTRVSGDPMKQPLRQSRRTVVEKRLNAAKHAPSARPAHKQALKQKRVPVMSARLQQLSRPRRRHQPRSFFELLPVRNTMGSTTNIILLVAFIQTSPFASSANQ
jgi:hypothetical protein